MDSLVLGVVGVSLEDWAADQLVALAHGGRQVGVVNFGNGEVRRVRFEDQERSRRCLEQPCEAMVRLYASSYIRRRPEPFRYLPNFVEEPDSARERPTDRAVRTRYSSSNTSLAAIAR